jgi:PKD repeat protein
LLSVDQGLDNMATKTDPQYSAPDWFTVGSALSEQIYYDSAYNLINSIISSYGHHVDKDVVYSVNGIVGKEKYKLVGKGYSVGEYVSFNGKTYKCIVKHWVSSKFYYKVVSKYAIEVQKYWGNPHYKGVHTEFEDEIINNFGGDGIAWQNDRIRKELDLDGRYPDATGASTKYWQQVTSVESMNQYSRHILVSTFGFNSYSTSAIQTSSTRLIAKAKSGNVKISFLTSAVNDVMRTIADQTGGSVYISKNKDEIRKYINIDYVDVLLGSCGPEPVRPIPNFTCSPKCVPGYQLLDEFDEPYGPMIYDSVSFTYTGIGNSDDVYSWSFGDPDSGASNYSSAKNPTHHYANEGSYSVKLVVTTRAFGRTNERYYQEEKTYEGMVLIGRQLPAPVAAFASDITTGDDDAGNGLLVNFYNQSTGFYDLNSLRWDFGDGRTSTSAATSHTFMKPGTYNVTLTVSNTSNCGNTQSNSVFHPIVVYRCVNPSILVNVKYTYIVKWNFSYDLLIGVVLHPLVYTFDRPCKPDSLCDTQLLPKDLNPIAVIDLKYSDISGDGAEYSRYKIGQNVFWGDTGFLSYEEVRTIDGKGVRLCFNSEFAFPEPTDEGIIVTPNVGPYTFTPSSNVLGITSTDFVTRMVEFQVFSGSSIISAGSFSPVASTATTTYTALQVADAINKTFYGEVLATVDKYGRVILIATSKGGIKVISKQQGSTANEVFGFSKFGNLGIVKRDVEKPSYQVTLYLACIYDSDESAVLAPTIKKLLGPYRVVEGEFQVKSTNYYEILYGEYPKLVTNRIYALPGHRYIGNSPVSLANIVETTTQPSRANSRHSGDEYLDVVACPDGDSVVSTSGWSIKKANVASLRSPYWIGMICNNEAYPNHINLWNDGDDLRFYSRKRYNASENCLELECHYDFVGPGPVVHNQLTAKKEGPYSLPLSPSKNRFLAIRRVSLVGENYTFYFTEGTSGTSEGWAYYNHETQTVTIEAKYISNEVNPSQSPIVTAIPQMSWPSSSGFISVQTNDGWEGVGTSSLSATILPTGHTGQKVTCNVWVQRGLDETTQSDDWIFVELPFTKPGTTATTTEIIKAMQRDSDWLNANNSNCHWTPTTSILNDNQYLRKNSSNPFQIPYEITDQGGKLRIRTSSDFDYRIRLGGTPEQCHANATFGWNPLGDMGDRVNQPIGPYYEYVYNVDLYVTKDLHPALGTNSITTHHTASNLRFKTVYNADKVQYLDDDSNVAFEHYEWKECGGSLVRIVYDKAIYLNVLYNLLKQYIACETKNLKVIGGKEVAGTQLVDGATVDTEDTTALIPWNDGTSGTSGTSGTVSTEPGAIDSVNVPYLPPSDAINEYPVIIPACQICVTVSSLTVVVACEKTGDCDDLTNYNSIYFSSEAVRNLVTAWGQDPFLSIILNEINNALLDPTNIGRYIDRFNEMFGIILADQLKITIQSTSTVSAPTFTISGVVNELTTLKNSILNNVNYDPLTMINDMAIFTVAYVENFNSSGSVTGIEYSQKRLSTLETSYEKFTIAPLSLYTLASSVIAADISTSLCTDTIDFTCDVDVFHTVYPVLFDMYTGNEVLPDSIKIDLCYCSYDAGAKNQITICAPSGQTNPLVGVIKQVEEPTVYLERTETLDLIDTTGSPVYEHTISWESDAMPMFLTTNADSTGEGDPSLIKSVEIKPNDEEMTIELCPAALQQYKVSGSISDCMVLPGDLIYTFASDAISTGSATITISGTQVMQEDFVELLEDAMQNLDIEVVNGVLTIDSMSDSVQVTVPVGDPFNLTNVEVIPSQTDLDVLIYYTYLEKDSTKVPKDIYISG